MTQILPTNPAQAAEKMVKIIEELVSFIEAETNALASNDGTSFAMNEQAKEDAIANYEQAAKEFHNRLADFQQVDVSIVERLTKAQESLAQTTQNNLKILEKFEENNPEQKPEDNQEKAS